MQEAKLSRNGCTTEGAVETAGFALHAQQGADAKMNAALQRVVKLQTQSKLDKNA